VGKCKLACYLLEAYDTSVGVWGRRHSPTSLLALPWPQEQEQVHGPRPRGWTDQVRCNGQWPIWPSWTDLPTPAC